MGNKASKPSRKLAGTISKNAKPTVTRSSNINQLPSQSLKQQYEQHSIQEESHKALNGAIPLTPQDQTIGKTTPDESLNQTPPQSSYNQGTFDALFLKKKLNQNEKLAPKNEPDVTLPEGKDGFDPQVGSQYNEKYVNSIFQLGKQIQSQSMDQKFDPNIRALKQLDNRKSLFEKGQQELQHQMDPNSGENGPEKEQKEVKRTMIHPRTLTAVLSDLKDSRVSNSTLAKDYQLHESFLSELGDRFTVATNTVIIEEEAKEGEIAPKIGAVARAKAAADGDQLLMDYNGEVGERVNAQRLKTLQSRLGMDTENDDKLATKS